MISVLIYNASFRTNTFLTVTSTSFFALFIVEFSLVCSLLAASILNNPLISTSCAAFWFFVCCIINMMSFCRLWDSSLLTLAFWGAVQAGKINFSWSLIRQRLLIVSGILSILNLGATIVLSLRASETFNPRSQYAVATKIGQISSHVARWIFLFVSVGIFELVHFNVRKRLGRLEQKGHIQRLRSSSGTEKSAPRTSYQKPIDRSMHTIVERDEDEGEVTMAPN